MAEIAINPEKLTIELTEAGLPVVSVSSDGRVDYSRDLTRTEKKTAEAVLSAHDPALSVDESRLKAYFEAGITVQDMVFALWKMVLQGDQSKTDKIQALMDEINSMIN